MSARTKKTNIQFRRIARDSLRVWRDINQNGESDAGELFTMDQAGISNVGAVREPPTGRAHVRAPHYFQAVAFIKNPGICCGL